MNYLIDTDTTIDYLSGRPTATHLLQSLAPQQLAISAVTYGEVYEGIHYGRNPAQALRVFRAFLRGITVLPVTRRIAHQFGIIRGDLRNRGLTIGDDDTFIAATAMHHNLTLVTRNLRHFQRVPGLVMYQHP